MYNPVHSLAKFQKQHQSAVKKWVLII